MNNNNSNLVTARRRRVATAIAALLALLTGGGLLMTRSGAPSDAPTAPLGAIQPGAAPSDASAAPTRAEASAATTGDASIGAARGQEPSQRPAAQPAEPRLADAPADAPLPVPDRRAEASQVPSPRLPSGVATANAGPMDAPSTQPLDASLAARQRAALPAAFAAHPDAGARAPGDPIGSFERLDLRTPTSRTLQLADGSRMFVSFPDPAYREDPDGWLASNTFRFDSADGGVVMRSAAGALAALPRDVSAGFDLDLGPTGVSLDVFRGLRAEALGGSELGGSELGGSGVVALALPASSPLARETFATYDDPNANINVRIEGLHDGFNWSVELGEPWVDAIDAGADVVRFVHDTQLEPSWTVLSGDAAVDATTSCAPVQVVDADGRFVYGVGAPRIWDAADVAAGSAVTRCGDAVTQTVRRQGERLVVSLEVDAAWLRDDARAFPVVVDPDYTFTFNSSRNSFGTVYDDAIYSNTPSVGRAQWGDHDTRRGFFVWPLSGFPDDGWALRTGREVEILGHQRSGSNNFDSGRGSNIDFRFVNYFRQGDWRQAGWTGSNPSADGNALFDAYFASAWHSESIIAPAPTAPGWTALCTGAACESGPHQEVEPNDVFADAGPALLGNHTGASQCANACGGNTNNGVCEDGGPGYTRDRCDFGDDCNDCGARTPADVVFEGTLAPNDVDMFAVQTDYAPAIQLAVESADGGPCTIDGVLELRLADEVIFRSDGVCPTINTCEDNPAWTCSLLDPGAYVVSFRGYAPFDTGDYRIRATVDRNPDEFNGLTRARWSLGTSFGDNPVNVFDANNDQPYINEMWRNTSRGTLADWWNADDAWYGITERSNRSRYPIFTLAYAQPVTTEPGNFTWVNRTQHTVRWEWDHAINSRWYALVDGLGDTVASNLFRYYEVSPGVYRYFIDEAGLTENTCAVRAARGENEIGPGPLSPLDRVATLARDPVAPSAPTAADGDFVIASTTSTSATLDFTYALPNLGGADACDTATNQTAIEARLVTCDTATVVPGSTASSSTSSITVPSSVSCGRVETRYINMDGVPSNWVRAPFQIVFQAGLVAPENLRVTDRGTQRITWAWDDSTTVEDAFVVADAADATRQIVATTTQGSTGSTYTWDEQGLGGVDGNNAFTRHVRAETNGNPGPNSANLTAYTLPRGARFDAGPNLQWQDTDAIVLDLNENGGAYDATIIIAEQPNNPTVGCSGAVLTRCRLEGSVPTECVEVALGTQADGPANGVCDTPPVDGAFDGRGYGNRYDGGGVVGGEGLFVGRREGVVYDGGLLLGETYQYTLTYVSGDDHPGASATFDMSVGCCFDPTAAATGYHGGAAACEGVCGTAVPGLMLWCEPPSTYTGDEANCDELDNDCDGQVDENAPSWFADVDGDGYGDPDSAVAACDSPGPGFVDNGDDCDDLEPTTNPAALDICDGVDNDCNPASNDGSADGALGAVCDTGQPGSCASGATTCGAPGATDVSFDAAGDIAGWNAYRGASWTVASGALQASSPAGLQFYGVDAPHAVNAFRAETSVSHDSGGAIGLAWDISGSDDFAYVLIDIGGPSAGDESVRIGRSVGGAVSDALVAAAASAEVGDDVRVIVQFHDGDVLVWTQNETDGGAIAFAGGTDIGPAAAAEVGPVAIAASGRVERMTFRGAEISCQPTILPDTVAESCNGLDDDCDGAVDEGFDVGMACDGADADSCEDGVIVCSASGDASVCADRSPALIWNFDALTGTVAHDASGNDQEGALSGGATYTADSAFGAGALELHGNAGYVSTTVDLNENAFTIGAWFRTTATTGGVFSVVDGDAFGSDGHDRHMYVRNGTLGYRVWSGASSRCDNQGPRVDDGAWHHGVITCEAGDVCRLYLDGAVICESGGGASAYSHFDWQTRFTVGHSADVGRFDGQIDHVTAQDFALDPSEVAALYADGLFTPEQGANAEVCDGHDNDCSGDPEPESPVLVYRDADGDTYGDPDASATFCSDDPAVDSGDYVERAGDCDDDAYSVNPGAPEIVGDEVDQTCDGAELCYVDADTDGARVTSVVASADLLCDTENQEARFDAVIDCVDDDPTIYPGALELCDGLDNDCDGDVDEGFLGASDEIHQPNNDCSDGQLIPTTDRLQTIFNQRGEALDAVSDANYVPETYYPVFGTLTFHFVAEGAGYENVFGWYNAGDDVSDPANRFMIFDCGDEPSDSTVLSVDFSSSPDWKGGPIGFFIATPQDQGTNCAPNNAEGYTYYTQLSLNEGDRICDDKPFLHYLVYKSTAYDSTYYFGFEDLFRGGDNDFEDVLVMVEGLVGDNEWYFDGDLDGYGDPNNVVVACTAPDGYVADDQDCMDWDPSVRPGAPELCDGLDNNCTDGLDDEGEDADNDGWTTCGGDCDDNDPTRNLADDDNDDYDTCGSVIDGDDPVLQEIELGAIGDTTVRDASSKLGDEVSLAVGNTSGGEPSRAVVAFDLTGIPAGTTVVKAEAFMYTYSRYDEAAGSIAPVDRNIAAHRVLRDWTEDDATAIETGVGDQWDTARLGVDDVDAASVSLDQALVTAADVTHPAGWVTWDVTDAVQAWLDGAPNYGLLFHAINQTAEGFEVRFYSKEVWNDARRPFIRVTFNGDPALVDCADDVYEVNPGATEACDGFDNDCDGDIDDADLDFDDLDGDGSRVCDCDDTDPSTYAGAPELCDYRDNDCDPTTGVDAPFNLGLPCDGGDADACSDGVRICSNDLTVAVCSDGATAMYRFEEPPAATVFDWTGDGAAGVLTGSARYVTDARHGAGAVAFDDGFLDPSDASAVRIPGAAAPGLEFTAAAWVYNEVSGDRYVVSRTADTGSNGLAFSVGGQLWFAERALGGPHLALPQGVWTHVAITFDRRALRVFLDGVEAHTEAIGWDQQVAAWASDVWFGQEQDANDGGLSSAQAFGGTMDDIVWYGHALDAAEIAQLRDGNRDGDINAELCDGRDNDCMAGIDDPYDLGEACDGADPDACNDGVVVCAAGGMSATCGDGAGTLLPVAAALDGTLGGGAISALFDVSGASRHGIITGAGVHASVGGREGYYLPGDGDSAVTVASSVASSPQFTFAAWVRGVGPDGPQTIANMGAAPSGDCNTNGFALRRDGIVRLGCESFDLGFDVGGAWTHLALAFDGEALRVHVNGNDTPAVSWTPCAPAGPGDTLPQNCSDRFRNFDWNTDLVVGQPIAGVDDGAPDPFEGYVDDIAWFSVALSEAGAAALAAGFSADDMNHELCDGADNDCRFGADDPYLDRLGTTCTVGVGACAATGYYVCSESGGGVACEATAGEPGAEICDGIDNDCDGQTDEDEAGDALTRDCYDGPSGTEGVGVCHGGTSVCAGGTWGACDGQRTPGFETCDGVDNDCDGTTDRNDAGELLVRQCYSGPAGTSGVGECTAGVRSCTEAGLWTDCVGEVVPEAESCDGLDNDCDGAEDAFTEDCYSGPDGTLGVGACEAGSRLCTAGAWGSCGGEVVPEAESCSLTGLDDLDCDGAPDDDCLEPEIEILGLVSGDPETDYTACEQTDGADRICAFLTVRVTNIGAQPLPAGTPMSVYVDRGATRELVSGPFELPSELSPAASPGGTGESVEIAYCFNPATRHDNVNVVVVMDLGEDGTAEDTRASQTLAACGDEICDGYDNDADGETDESPEACGPTAECVFSESDSVYLCASFSTGEAPAAAPACVADSECGSGEFCSGGQCVFSGRWERPADAAEPIDSSSTTGCSAARGASGGAGSLLWVAALLLWRRRRSVA